MHNTPWGNTHQLPPHTLHLGTWNACTSILSHRQKPLVVLDDVTFSHSPPVRSSSVICGAAWGGRCKSLLNGDVDVGSVHSNSFTIMLAMAQLPCCHVTVALMQRLYFQWTKSIKMAAAMWNSCNTACMLCSKKCILGPEREANKCVHATFWSEAALKVHKQSWHCCPLLVKWKTEGFFPSSVIHYGVSSSVMCYRWSFHFTLCSFDHPWLCKHAPSVSLPPVNRPENSLCCAPTSCFLLLHTPGFMPNAQTIWINSQLISWYNTNA